MLLHRSSAREDRDPAKPRREGAWFRFMHSRGTFIASATLFIAIAAAGLYVVIFPADTADDPAAVQATPDAASSAAVEPRYPLLEVQPALNLCPEQKPKEVPPETLILTSYSTSWVPEGGWLVPQSKDAGPRELASPRACFTRSPEGALYSLATFFIENLAAPSVEARITLVQARASRTGAYEQMMQELSQNPSLVQVTGRPDMRISGYRWLGYTPDVAQLDIQYQLLSGDRAGTSVAMTVDAVWESNDWLVVVPNEGTELYRPAAQQAVFTPWGAPA